MNKIKLIIGFLVVLVLAILGNSLITTVGAGEIVVKQSAFTGSLTVWDTPGPKWKAFGDTTTYRRSDQYSFSAATDQGSKVDQSIKCRFNDGGHGNISGTFQFDLPTNPNQMKVLHMKFHNQDGIRQQLIRPAVERSVYLSGPLMSSKESAAERRGDLLNYIEDQVKNGVYKTVTKDEKIPDPITGKDKTVIRVELIKEANGNFARQEKSPLTDMGVSTYSYNINGLSYDAEVEAQIKGQQKLAMDVQTAIAQSKEAEQRALTAAKQGEANAAQAKAEQEVIKMTEVTQAEKQKAVALLDASRKKEVAELDVQTAALRKQEQTLLGEGEANRARAMMQANGYLPEKLAAWVKVALVAAESAGKQRQTPDVVMGSSQKVGLDDIMQMSLAKQLGVGLK
jgi:regulator of protease activity HflC (stomatin/prohibitin superfamily)